MENADLVTAAYFKSIQAAFRFTVRKKFFYDFKKVQGFMLISNVYPKKQCCGSALVSMRIRIQEAKPMRIWIQEAEPMQIHTDLDPNLDPG
jgi:hypothetical protein